MLPILLPMFEPVPLPSELRTDEVIFLLLFLLDVGASHRHFLLSVPGDAGARVAD